MARYFATVLRATGNPSFLSISESRSSDRGCALSSSAIIAASRSRRASFVTYSPESVVIPDVKNFLSSTVPFGVEAYL